MASLPLKGTHHTGAKARRPAAIGRTRRSLPARTPRNGLAAAGIALLTLAALAGCGGHAPEPALDVAGRTGDTLTVVEPPLETPPLAVRPPADTLAGGMASGETPVRVALSPADTVAPAPDAFVPGWRVQIFSSTFLSEAEQVGAEARQATGLPTYVEYRAPLYRVRLGDFGAAAQADSARVRLADAGYDDAAVVATLVLRPSGS